MRVHFSTDDLPPSHREQVWLDVVAKHALKITPLDRPEPATFRAQFDAQIAGRFALYELQTSHQVGGRTAADVARENSGGFQLRRVAREQVYSVAPTSTRPVDVRLARGDFCLISCGWQSQQWTKGGISLGGLVIPHEVLSLLLTGGRLTQPVAVFARSPLGSLLSAAFEAAESQLPALSAELADAVLQNLCGLVALACGASEEGRWNGRDSLRAARLEAAKRYVDQHLAEPNLTPGTAASALGISLRHLHLLFEATGMSFAQYVTQRRLQQCRATLTSPAGIGRSVADIAFGWGFNSLATFYRAFEREFGLPPAALRNVMAAGHAD